MLNWGVAQWACGEAIGDEEIVLVLGTEESIIMLIDRIEFRMGWQKLGTI